jgi:hypothetical protein
MAEPYEYSYSSSAIPFHEPLPVPIPCFQSVPLCKPATVLSFSPQVNSPGQSAYNSRFPCLNRTPFPDWIQSHSQHRNLLHTHTGGTQVASGRQAFLPTQQKCETQTLLEPALRKAEHMASNAPQHNPSNLSFWIWLGRPIRPLYKYYVTPAKFFLRLTPAVSYRLFPSIDHSEASQTFQPANIAGHYWLRRKTTGMLLRTKRFLAMQHNHQG